MKRHASSGNVVGGMGGVGGGASGNLNHQKPLDPQSICLSLVKHVQKVGPCAAEAA